MLKKIAEAGALAIENKIAIIASSDRFNIMPMDEAGTVMQVMYDGLDETEENLLLEAVQTIIQEDPAECSPFSSTQ